MGTMNGFVLVLVVLLVLENVQSGWVFEDEDENEEEDEWPGSWRGQRCQGMRGPIAVGPGVQLWLRHHGTAELGDADRGSEQHLYAKRRAVSHAAVSLSPGAIPKRTQNSN